MTTETFEQTSFSTGATASLVGQFGQHVIADEPLAVVQATQDIKDDGNEEETKLLEHQWMSLFIPRAKHDFETVEEMLLEQSSQELAKAWEKFQKCVPKEYQAQIQDGPPKFEEVAKAVAVAHSTWKAKEKSKVPKVKNLFSGLCQSLYDYKDVFAVIPNQDKYVCLLTGTFAVIVKATTNYRKLANGISDCLDNLGEDISYWKRQLEIHNDNKFMKRYVAQLYVLIFQLLVDIMSWYKSSMKRISHSFDSQAFDKIIKVKRDKMQVLAQRLVNESKLATEAKVQTLMTASEQTDVEKALERFRGELESIITQSVQKSLREEAAKILWEHQNRGAGRSVQDIEYIRFLGESPSSGGGQVFMKAQIQANTLPLHKYLQPGLVKKFTSRSQNLNLNMEALRRISCWSKAPVSQMLWLCGPFQASVPSRYTLAAANLISATEKAQIPVLAYFCQRDGYQVPGNDAGSLHENSNPSRVAALVCSLIAQFVSFIPTTAIETQIDDSTTRFASLDGTLDTLPRAVSLLKDLLAIRPTTMFCFVDGLHLYQRRLSQVESQALNDIINMFRFTSQNSLEDPPRVIKTLYTTDGFIDLLGMLKGDERLNSLDLEHEDRIRPEVDVVEMNGLQII